MSFAYELRRAMTERGVTTRQLADMLGCSQNLVISARKPTWRPVHHFAVAMAEALTCDRLAELSLAANTRTCLHCRATFVITRTHGTERRYCSKGCQVNAAHAYQRRLERDKATRERSRRLLDERLTLHQEAVAAFCKGCEPEGLCRTAECPLRSVSPLPLARVRAA